ncbi:MAG: COX15/CtaA family protein [Rickettsiales bacterium]|nr:COX15/CtaA family protein [Pseudomonadota bacterium]MDA0967135.1 COX15/CtaA family protein [Pseudomonadota bacterium]MDG4542379.1 COX15/CtaA family protein [Rickettsiales bacterium]MDG4544883.1 COX15/CtaA family protein [Rickettsiales bacterium]MDG4547006.1 COX15/CtaA family protein [Rickettsiales bacterium]
MATIVNKKSKLSPYDTVGNSNNRKIALWLFVCCFMVAMMVGIGGVTRLTESGLSMTGWKPVTGWLPPLTQSHWLEHYEGYRKSPEYKHINYGMTLDEFKGIFRLEFIHRLAGRITGLVFFIPLVFFIYKRVIDKKLALKLTGVLFLGGFQAVVGWLMVSSGLKDTPHVSQYWLAFHLCMAFILFAILFLMGLGRYMGNKQLLINSKGIKKFSYFVTALIFVQVFWGALVAGLDAGLIYNTFPLMEGAIVPKGLLEVEPWYINFFDNVKTVQFTHRCIAIFLSLVIFVFWLKARRTPIYKVSNLLLFILIIQFCLGVLTLIHVVPIPLASAHQMVALALFAVSLYINYVTKITGNSN